MKVLYLNVPDMLQPWYDDFRTAVGEPAYGKPVRSREIHGRAV